jgi:4-hydroxybenzoate polyprenyltransferase
MVKLSHSVFALPFAFSGAALAAARYGISWRQILLVAAAMFTARNAAMGFNRLADHAIDADNPRTKARELPAGLLTRGVVWAVTIALSAAFVAASFALNPLCGMLSPVALAIVFGYSYTKRFTAASQLVLGLSLAVAPVGAWLAIRGRFEAVALVLGAAVVLWVAGFDTIYACQDADFDRREGLRSIPARLGVPRALVLARELHAGAILLLIVLYRLAPLHPLYLAGVAVVAGLLAWEHTLVRADDLSRVMQAFNLNGWVSLGYFGFTAAAAWLA